MPSKRKLKNQIECLEGLEPEEEDVWITVGKIPKDADPEDCPEPIRLELEA